MASEAGPTQPVQLKTERPKGKSDADLVAEANAAIAKGAPKDVVVKQLAAYGVSL
jgi:hypothetical protein